MRFQTGKKGAKLLGLDEREGFRVVLDGRLQVYEATWLDVGMMLTDAEVMMRDTTGKERNAIRTAIRKVEAEVDRARSYGGFQYRETKEETAARLAGRFDLEVGIRGERVEFSFVSDEGRTSFPIPVNRSRFVAEEILRNARIIEEQK